MLRLAALGALLTLAASSHAAEKWKCGMPPPPVPMPAAALHPFLRNDEKAFLAAVLAAQGAAAELERDLKTAGDDPRLRELVLDKWRGRAATFAAADQYRPTPDVDAVYGSYRDLMDAPMYAYLVARFPTMTEDDCNELAGYLDDINQDLKDDGHLGIWNRNAVLPGIFDAYRADLHDYVVLPLTRQVMANGPAADQALEAHRQEAEGAGRGKAERVAAMPKLGAPPGAGIASNGATANSGPAVAKPEKAKDALGQAKNAAGDDSMAEASERLGKSFDGGVNSAPPPPVAAPERTAAAEQTLASSSGGGTPSLIAEPPPPSDDILSDLAQVRTGSGGIPWRKLIPDAGGALALGLIGLKLGGPLGAVIGAAVGLVAGEAVTHKLLRH